MSDTFNRAGRRPARQRLNPRGSIYDRIAVAREMRDALAPTSLTAGKQSNLRSQSVESTKSAAAVVAHKDDDQPATELVKAKSIPKNVLPELVAVPEPANNPEEPDSRRPAVLLWLASIAIAILLVGYVVMNSRIQDDVVLSSVPAPVQPASTLEPFELEKLNIPEQERGPIFPISQTAPTTTSASALVSENSVSPTLAMLDTQNAPAVDPSVEIASIQITQDASTSSVIATRFPDAAVRLIIATPETTSAPTETTSTPVEALGFDASRIRVVLNLPSSRPRSVLEDTENALETAGFTVTSQQVNLVISKSNVRYFHSEDQEAARVLAESIDAELRDFTGFRPLPKSGFIEVWMSGRSIVRAADSPDQSSGPLTELGSELRRLRQNIQRALRGG